MVRIVVLLLVISLTPVCLFAGPIYGSILDSNGRSVSQARINIVCGGASFPGSTLSDGSYRINVTQTGRCGFTVAVPGAGDVTAEVVSSADAAQYNFRVAVVGGHSALLRR